MVTISLSSGGQSTEKCSISAAVPAWRGTRGHESFSGRVFLNQAVRLPPPSRGRIPSSLTRSWPEPRRRLLRPGAREEVERRGRVQDQLVQPLDLLRDGRAHQDALAGSGHLRGRQRGMADGVGSTLAIKESKMKEGRNQYADAIECGPAERSVAGPPRSRKRAAGPLRPAPAPAAGSAADGRESALRWKRLIGLKLQKVRRKKGEVSARPLSL